MIEGKVPTKCEIVLADFKTVSVISGIVSVESGMVPMESRIISEL
jgi:hypothetical protein